MKLNNKGYMLVEIILASVIAMIMAYFLIDITVRLVNTNNDYYIESILTADKSIITKTIMDDVNNENLRLTNVVQDSNNLNKITLTFKNINTNATVTKDLIIDKENKTISYGDYKKELQEELNLGDIEINNNQANKTLGIKIDAFTNFSSDNYGLDFAISYGEDLSIEVPITDNCSRVDTVLGTIKYDCDTPDLNLTSCDNSKIDDERYYCGESTIGIYSAQDDLGTSYYFRGDVENNYVKFGKWKNDTYYSIYSVTNINGVRATLSTKNCDTMLSEIGASNFMDCAKIASAGDDMYWRIIRLNGDGTIRMIYAGTEAQENGSYEAYEWQYGNMNPSIYKQTIGLLSYNTSYDDNAYVGYMYGTIGASTYASTHANSTSSYIKSYIDSWYSSNFYNTTYENYIADAIYCNDRKVSTNNPRNYTGNGSGKTLSAYMALERLWYSLEENTPTLKCSQTADRFSKSTRVSGVTTNGKLTYPVGLITADEAFFAGSSDRMYANLYYYLYSGGEFWTMTPGYLYTGSQAYNFTNSYNTTTTPVSNSTHNGVRPVITLKSSVVLTGTGEIDNPYRIS